MQQTISQENMTTTNKQHSEGCPAQALLKSLSGKWKPELFKAATAGPIRFSQLLRTLEGANKQSLSVALHELEIEGILNKEILSVKPLHVAYHLSEKGIALIPIFKQLEDIAKP